MRFRVSTIVAVAFLLLLPTAAMADLGPYSQDFETLDPLNPGALSGDGWLVFGNVFNAGGGYLYGYGPFPAPNLSGAFSGVDVGQGGPEQGAQQLVVFSDYNNGDHAACGGDPLDPSSPTCRFIEANVFQEQTIGAADVGTTWRFDFDAKRGNIEGATTAKAFFKTLDPNAGFALTNFIWIDMTGVPETWGSYALEIFIDASLEGQILQFGYLSTATAFQGSGIFYDNINFGLKPLAVSLDVKPESCPNPIYAAARGLVPAAVLGTADLNVFDIDVDSLRLDGIPASRSGYEDVATPYGGDLCGCTELGPDGFVDLELKFNTRDLVGSYPSGERVMTLTGNLLDGTPIEGLDCVVVLGGGGGVGTLSDLHSFTGTNDVKLLSVPDGF